MALKIRLRQQGRTNHHVYRLVVMDSRQARDGRYVECLGWYNPHARDESQVMAIKSDRIQHWISCGAEVTEKAAALLKKGAPEVVSKQREQQQNLRVKLAAKRRGRNKAAAQ
jgi:small subunit ribosomal protein S16